MLENRADSQHLPEGLLGELEAAVMQIIWQHEEVTVREVWEALKPARPLAYTTVMTVMSRLAQKGLLVTRKQGRTYYYRALATTPDEFVAQQAQRAVQQVLANFGDLAVAHFLRELEASSPERLAALCNLINKEQTDAT